MFSSLFKKASTAASKVRAGNRKHRRGAQAPQKSFLREFASKVLLKPSIFYLIVGVYAGYRMSQRIITIEEEDDDFEATEAVKSILAGPRGLNDPYEIRIESLNKKFNTYERTITKATTGASVVKRNEGGAKLLGVEVNDLTEAQIDSIKELNFLTQQALGTLTKERDTVLALLQETALSNEVPPAPTDARERARGFEKSRNILSLERTLQAILEKQMDVEIAFVSDMKQILTPEQAAVWTEGAKKFSTVGLMFQNNLLGSTEAYRVQRPKIFVLDFKGDIMASRLKNLREEITAVILAAKPARGDAVVVRINSPGGTVTGYGAAAAQLERLKGAGLRVVACVDEVAASGGYMMACVANDIVASPFALLGSVGVVTTMPNFSERMTREGISVEEVTAGKYKRTLTPYKKSTPEDRAKTQQDVEDILVLFKSFIQQNRPMMDLEKIATGEVWTGRDALKMGLCDRLGTFEDLILGMRAEGADVYSVKYTLKREYAMFAGSIDNMSASSSSSDGIFDRIADTLMLTAARWFQQRLQRQLDAGLLDDELSGDIRSKYLALDRSSPRLN